MRAIAGLILAAFGAAASGGPALPPHLGVPGQDEYRDYLDAPDHRAFAIAPGGAWGWVAGEVSAEVAEDKALAMCQGHTEQRCVSYAVDEKTVFDAAQWPRLWRPYATSLQASRAITGRQRGQRMHDLVFTDARGRAGKLSALRGKVVVLHFWGAWCPPCRSEMPELQKLNRKMAHRKDIAFVILQGREKIEVSRQWAQRQGITLPLADSGSSGDGDAVFRLADGGTIRDREIASRFPMTYVLDRRGLVVFSHAGPIPDWSQYEPFLSDAAASAAGQ